MPTKPTFFKTPQDFRAWLEKHHETERELLVGFYKVDSGRPSITWPQSVDEALCFGWIDGVRKRVNDEAYTIRFTPRKPTSIWSAVNIKRMGELAAEGRVRPLGAAAFARCDAKKSAIYSYEREAATLEGELLARFKADKKAWAFYEAQPPGYKRLMAHRVTSAKKPETRDRRLAQLIACSRRGERMDLLAPAKTSAK